MSKKYPHIERLGLFTVRREDKYYARGEDFVYAHNLEALFAKATKVTSGWEATKEGAASTHVWRTDYEPHMNPTHTALLIGVEKIEPKAKDTAESLLREILFDRYEDSLISPADWGKLQSRAHALLDADRLQCKQKTHPGEDQEPKCNCAVSGWPDKSLPHFNQCPLARAQGPKEERK